MMFCFLLLYFHQVVIFRQEFLCPLYFTPLFLRFPSVSLSYFIYAVPIRECLGKHSCMSSNFL